MREGARMVRAADEASRIEYEQEGNCFGSIADLAGHMR
jgi:hypothetical protein